MAELASPTSIGVCPGALVPFTYCCARRPARIFPSAGPRTVQINTTFPGGSSWLLSRIDPLYFSSAPDPAGLNPQDILCAVSWPGLINVQVRTPRLAGAFSAYAADIKATTDTQVSTMYRMAILLLAPCKDIAAIRPTDGRTPEVNPSCSCHHPARAPRRCTRLRPRN